MEPAPAHVPPGTILGGKFRVIRVIGAGGMGAVYEVHHELTRHRRALKLLHPHVRAEHPAAVARFLREASVAGTLGDPHIVETFDAGELPTGEPYLVMELLEGEPLTARLARGPMPIEEAIAIARQLASALAVAHERGIVHRDLKPDNVFLTTRSGELFVKVLDFGISKFDPSQHAFESTQDGSAPGTPYYMSPEQVRGARDVDGRSDVWAIGVVLYECLARQRPFEANTLQELAIKINEGDRRPLRELRPDVPPDVEAIVDRTLSLDRTERPDARALAEDLGKHLGFARTAMAPIPSVPPRANAPELARTEMAAIAPATTAREKSRAWLLALLLIPAAALLLIRKEPAPVMTPAVAPPPPPSASVSIAPSAAPSPTPSPSPSISAPPVVAAPKPSPSPSTKAHKTGLADNPF